MNDLPLRLTSVRPVVRYVDAEQAVIDTHLSALWSLPQASDQPPNRTDVEVFVEINGSDGFHDESQRPVQLQRGEGYVRFELVQPQRWWPAGMGEQSLYEMAVSLVANDEIVDQRTVMLGLTSVRAGEADRSAARLLVNGQECAIQSVVTVDRIDETQLLPVTGGSILLVRDHYGPDVLYDAADRAGILLVQCIPIHPDGTPEVDVAAQVERLGPHPSLAGWFVGHLGRISDRVSGRIKALDPTRSVFREFPIEPIEPAA